MLINHLVNATRGDVRIATFCAGKDAARVATDVAVDRNTGTATYDATCVTLQAASSRATWAVVCDALENFYHDVV